MRRPPPPHQELAALILKAGPIGTAKPRVAISARHRALLNRLLGNPTPRNNYRRP